MSANEFYTNHMTTFLCHVTTSFGHHVISFLQPTVQNSNGGFTTLVILIVFSVPGNFAKGNYLTQLLTLVIIRLVRNIFR